MEPLKTVDTLATEWPRLLTLLAANWEEQARPLGALERKRGIGSAETLLRLIFAYAYCGLSLRATALWAREAHLAGLSSVALWKRLRKAGEWLGWLVTAQLARRVTLPASLPSGLRLRLVDATVISKPGSQGTDFRLHLGLDLGRLLIDRVELTGAEGGETLKRLELQPGEVVMGDRGYAQRQGIAAVVQAGADVLVRLNWQNVPLQDASGRRFDLLAALRSIAEAQQREWAVRTAPARDGTPAVSGRLVALRKSAQAAEAARRKLLQQARKKGKTPSERTLEAAGYVFVFTTLTVEQLATEQVLELYRFRWQIELTFKRMKSLIGLDELAMKDEALGRTFLLAKILATLLIEEESHRRVDFSPWGDGPPPSAVGVAGVSGDGGNALPSGRGDAHLRPVGSRRGASEPSVSRSATPAFQSGGQRSGAVLSSPSVLG